MTGDSLTAPRPGAWTPEYSVLTWGQHAGFVPARPHLPGRYPEAEGRVD